MSRIKTQIILNPASAAGRTKTRSARILRLIDRSLGSSYSLHITEGPGDATLVTRTAVANGFNQIVAVGGDGTIQEVVNGFFCNGSLINTECRLGIINCGTGHGFAQSLGLPDSIEDQANLLEDGSTRMVDLGRVEYQNGRAELSSRYFVNECQLGIGAAVVRRVQGNHKRFGGSVAFGLGVLQTVFDHRNQTMKLVLNGGQSICDSITGIVIANGAYTGGGMNLAPGASLDDRELNVLVMHDLSLAERLRTFPKIYSGKHLSSTLFSYQSTKRVTVLSEETVYVEADGELIGTTPCNVEVVPLAIRVQSTKSNGAKQ